MSLPDTILRGAIADIIKREGVTGSAAEQISRFLESEKRLVDLKAAPDELRISERQMYRWIKAGRLAVETVAGHRMVDVSRMSAPKKRQSRDPVRTI